MKNMLGFVTILSLIASIILVFICTCNYLIDYHTTGEHFTEAMKNNVYVSYWVYLLIFFAGTLVLSFLGSIILRPSVVEEEGFRVYEDPVRMGYGQGPPVEEYVTVRMKKSELSKVQGS
ncbi:hypothetical protein [Falsibacillus albus]|uniref:Uncharacterized protein n=1 Tax=Falsibacillus albus TaxID=2478915 RepID=A0A3L7JSK5_9BACI|nr:hypothetical protein [Falsibacillus albus]RLQ93676.1 hypothetical protein D9X91_16985 [Falsibacillus albus]